MPAPTVFRSDYRINTSLFDNDQDDVRLDVLANGRFVISWTSNDTDANDDDVRYSLLDANGDGLSAGVTDADVRATPATDERLPAVAGLADNRIVHVWEEGLGGEVDLYALVRNADGSLFKGRFGLTTVTGSNTDDQTLMNVVGLDSGNFLIAYKDDGAAGLLRFSIHSIAGDTIAGPTALSAAATTPSGFNIPDMARLANGNAVVTWSAGAIGATQRKFAIVSPSGTIVRVETDVNPEDATVESGGGKVVALANGNFAMIFHRAGEANPIQGRLFDANGNALGARFDISTGAATGNVDATALADGRFMVVYANNIDLFGQMMFADGGKDGGLFTVTDEPGIQDRPILTTLADGRVVVAWNDDFSTDESDIHAAIYDPRESGLYGAASGLDDDWFGTGFGDTIFAGTGRDAIRGAGGIDFLHGEAGNDTLAGDAGADRLYGGNNEDTLAGGDDGDFLYGGLGNDTLNGAAGADSAYGQDGDDMLNGGSENDTLDGGNGNDTANGEAGNDNLRGRDGADTLNGGTENDDARGGNGNDTVNGEDGNDTFLAGEAGADTVSGGLGNDRIDGGGENDILNGDANSDNITGGTGNDDIFGSDGDDGNGLGLLRGEDGNDRMFGNAGIDRLEGGNGDDRLEGGLGNDVLLGGAGFDSFVFGDDAEGNDRIDDWVAADDQIQVDGSEFGGGLAAFAEQILPADRLVVGAAPVANQAFGQFLYNTATGQLSWDVDGTGAAAAVNVCRLLNGGVAVGTLAVGDFDIAP
jgi:Ca2+-binding RTX toxin-like protein